jgi:hypothetical protein
MRIKKYVIAFVYRIGANMKGYKIPLFKEYYDWEKENSQYRK